MYEKCQQNVQIITEYQQLDAIFFVYISLK